MKLQPGIKAPIIARKPDIRTVELNGKKFEFEVTFGGSFELELALVLALLSLNDPRINKILHEFRIDIKDRNGNILEY